MQERLVENSRERMRGVNGNGGEERVDLLLEVLGGEVALALVEVLPAEDADAGFFERRNEALAPGAVLIESEGMEHVAEADESLVGGKAAFVGFLWRADGFFHCLQGAGDADFYELVEVAGGDGEELDALKEGIGGVVSLFQDAAVEEHPAFVAVVEAATSLRRRR